MMNNDVINCFVISGQNFWSGIAQFARPCPTLPPPMSIIISDISPMGKGRHRGSGNRRVRIKKKPDFIRMNFVEGKIMHKRYIILVA